LEFISIQAAENLKRLKGNRTDVKRPDIGTGERHYPEERGKTVKNDKRGVTFLGNFLRVMLRPKREKVRRTTTGFNYLSGMTVEWKDV